MVSLARSGDSRKRRRAAQMLEIEPELRHLVLTCNRQGKLATASGTIPGSRSSPDDRTNDRSLVMTSSFTNLALEPAF